MKLGFCIPDSWSCIMDSKAQGPGLQEQNFPIFRILQAIISRTQGSLTGSETWSFFLSTDKDECLGNPCKNGATCMNIPGSYRCKCTSAYTGRNCEKGQDRYDIWLFLFSIGSLKVKLGLIGLCKILMPERKRMFMFYICTTVQHCREINENTRERRKIREQK